MLLCIQSSLKGQLSAEYHMYATNGLLNRIEDLKAFNLRRVLLMCIIFNRNGYLSGMLSAFENVSHGGKACFKNRKHYNMNYNDLKMIGYHCFLCLLNWSIVHIFFFNPAFLLRLAQIESRQYWRTSFFFLTPSSSLHLELSQDWAKYLG